MPVFSLTLLPSGLTLIAKLNYNLHTLRTHFNRISNMHARSNQLDLQTGHHPMPAAQASLLLDLVVNGESESVLVCLEASSQTQLLVQ